MYSAEAEEKLGAMSKLALGKTSQQKYKLIGVPASYLCACNMNSLSRAVAQGDCDLFVLSALQARVPQYQESWKASCMLAMRHLIGCWALSATSCQQRCVCLPLAGPCIIFFATGGRMLAIDGSSKCRGCSVAGGDKGVLGGTQSKVSEESTTHCCRRGSNLSWAAAG
jgi:hypothetical protein